MMQRGSFRTPLLALVAAALLAAPATATTLIRMSLDQLISTNQALVLAEVTDTVSYWNDDGTFILTDVVVEPIETLKGEDRATRTITLMGGTVDGLTSLIVGGAQLLPGHTYLLFLDRVTLPGAPDVVTVRDHVQGVFEIVHTDSGEVRAISQASDHPLLADTNGISVAPGGVDGLVLDQLLFEIQEALNSASAKKEESR